jgi:hypothetical protein
MTESLDGSLPLEGRVAAQPPGGVGGAARNFSTPSTASATPSGCFAAISPSRGERRLH